MSCINLLQHWIIFGFFIVSPFVLLSCLHNLCSVQWWNKHYISHLSTRVTELGFMTVFGLSFLQVFYFFFMSLVTPLSGHHASQMCFFKQHFTKCNTIIITVLVLYNGTLYWAALHTELLNPDFHWLWFASIHIHIKYEPLLDSESR